MELRVWVKEAVVPLRVMMPPWVERTPLVVVQGLRVGLHLPSRLEKEGFCTIWPVARGVFVFVGQDVALVLVLVLVLEDVDVSLDCARLDVGL